jgi:colanic acid biosynthesis glycosyl transferase WcaI
MGNTNLVTEIDPQQKHIRIKFISHVQFEGFQERIIARMRDDGFDASDVYLISGAHYRTSRSIFSRIWLRLRMFVLFPLKLALRLPFERANTILIATSNPFFAPLVAKLFAPRKARVVYLLYDLYPDALVYSGKMREGSPAHRMLDRVQRFMLRKCDASVFLGEHLLAHVRKRFGEPRNPVIIPVGADDDAFDDPLAAKAAHAPAIRLLYCGNMGYLHDTSTLSDAIHKLSDLGGLKDLDFRFHASGKGYERFRADIHGDGQTSVKLEGYLDSANWRKVMAEADIALVTMRPGSDKVVMPSKSYSAMQAGQAILAVAPRDSDLADLVTRHACGWVVEPGDADGLAKLLESLPQRRDEIRAMQANALKAAKEYYSATVIAKQWENLCVSLAKSEAPCAKSREHAHDPQR